MPEESGAAPAAAREPLYPPRDDLIRARRNGIEYRAVQIAEGLEPSAPTLFGHFARFDEWAEINSIFEGEFIERIAPGAFKKTFREQGDKIRVLLEHGQDPQLGNKPIAEVVDLREDDDGAYYEARLFDGLAPLVLDGLRAGQYGASFRFSVMRDSRVERPSVSDHNPKGLPERTLQEIRVPEFGPVTFGAYSGATSGVRSLTDEFLIGRAALHPDRLRSMLAYLEARDRIPQTSPAQGSDEDPAPPQNRAEHPAHPVGERRDTPSRRGTVPIYGMNRKETSTPWRL